MEPLATTAHQELFHGEFDASKNFFEERRYTSGTHAHPISVVEVLSRKDVVHRLPVVMIHGGFHSGRSFLHTPDNREGWAHLFAKRGHRVLVPDWPGHGDSPGLAQLTTIGSTDVVQAVGALLQEVGRCILLAHSAGGPIAWSLAEKYSELVAAVIGVAPGSPANLLPILANESNTANSAETSQTAVHAIYAPPDQPVQVDETFVKAYWANSTLFPVEHLQAYMRTIVPESPRILNERFNIGGVGLYLQVPALVASRPILIVTGEHDLRHPKHVDSALADYLGATFSWLPDKGIRQNGHMLMLESNSDAIAAVLFEWLDAQIL